MSKNCYKRPLRDLQIDWNSVTAEWHRIFGEKNAEFIQFPQFIDVLKKSFEENPDKFLSSINKAHKLTPNI